MPTANPPSSSRQRAWGRLVVVLSVLVALASAREAAFARNRQRSPLVVPPATGGDDDR